MFRRSQGHLFARAQRRRGPAGISSPGSAFAAGTIAPGEGGFELAYVITDPCIGTKDTACVDVCPVDCIHPRKDEVEFATTRMLYIQPDECIDCGACIPACPVAAIYDSPEATPVTQHALIDANAIYRSGDEDAVQHAEDLVGAHIAANPRLMAIDPAERAAAHLQPA
jgi:ferredoxin